ncbi:hypothetical protein B0H63DRAFT_464455 [Podospora didyma]|uniref:Uncharacterized protein n=1 Tax=Podospora didyma TaxID=330526 RepID=A0AAE0NY60_9PEZI|nr:hypothetical protein B0H63DRAFT_464455 [Podospora didyma]
MTRFYLFIDVQLEVYESASVQTLNLRMIAGLIFSPFSTTKSPKKMHFRSALLAVSALAVAGTTQAAAIGSRIPLMGYFRVSTEPQCPLQVSDFIQLGLPLGPDDTSCRNFYNNTVYSAINVEYFHPQCQLVLFNTFACTDPGTISGTGCWVPQGGIKAYKATCPYRTW